MKTAKVTTWAGAVLGLLMFAGCQPAGQQEAASGAEPQPEQRQEVEPVGEPFTITITGNDNMRFDIEEFTVTARQPVTIVFENVGTMPKESMGHNLVVVEQGVDVNDFANAGATQVRNDYIHPDREDKVIAHTPILGPGETFEISFTAPAEPGDYPYICTFPGHTPAGMVGAMKVE